jgi:Na+/H+-dicarboxylate symporter
MISFFRRLIRGYIKSNLLLRILMGLLLGAVAGLLCGPDIQWIKPLGDLFIRLLKMIVMPVIIFTLVVGAAGIHTSKLGRVGVKALLFYVLTSAFAVALGLLFGNMFSPGEGMALTAMHSAGDNSINLTKPDLIDTLLNIVPSNPFAAIAEGNVLATIFVSLFTGVALAHIRECENVQTREAAQALYQFFEGGSQLVYVIVHWVLQFAPIGVFALIAVVFGNQGAAAFGPLIGVTLTVYCAFVAHLVLVYGGILTWRRISFRQFLIKARAAMVTSFVTRSSGGTLPVSMEVAEKEMGVSRGIFSFTLPLGATLNMDGTAIYQGVCAVFIGLAIGLPLSFEQQLTVIVTAVLASIGTAGVPGAGAIMLLMVLDSVGLKVEQGSTVAAAYAMIFGIDALLDMGRTSLNVTGDLTVTCVVAQSEGELQTEVWNNRLPTTPAAQKI